MQIPLQFLKAFLRSHEGLLVVLVLCLQALYHRLLVLVISASLRLLTTARLSVIHLLLLSPEKTVLLAPRLLSLVL